MTLQGARSRWRVDFRASSRTVDIPTAQAGACLAEAACCSELNTDIDTKMLFSKVDSPENKQLWTYHKNKNAKSGVCSKRINFRKLYFYIDIGVKT